MENNLLVIDDLKASVKDKEILTGLNLEIGRGEIHVIMGPNGAGKSTLAHVIMGNPNYKIDSGKINFNDIDITDEDTDKIAKEGIFMSFQNAEEIPGISLENFLRTAKSIVRDEEIGIVGFRKELLKRMKELEMDESYVTRHINVGFLGGEKKKSEILQLLILDPKLAILDETDSGLDVDAINIVSDGINKYHTEENSIIVITHNTRMIEQLKPDFVHILVDGKIVESGDVSLARKIDSEGFSEMERM